MAQAASATLGPTIAVRTEGFPDDHPEAVRPPTEGERSALLSWDSPAHERARLRLCKSARDCSEEWLTFTAGDPETERGRTLGLLAASLFVDSRPPPEPPVVKPVVRVAAHEFPRAELSAKVAAVGPGDATGVGAAVGADYAPARAWRFGVAAEVRLGELGRAQANTRIAAGSAQVGVSLLHPARPLWLGLSGGVGAYYLSVSHFSSDDPSPDRQGRLLLGGTVAGTTEVDLGASSSVCLDLGAELLSGRTEVVVHQQIRGVWPLLVPLVRLGLRTGF